ncbi:MAG: glycosyltransferase family 2 protein [Bosea sp.]|jgi:glycosyltransferase involved in cell wall biosynthesis|nr:glycosyltransferase family 2 protein [Bosea sp. (in: a-proteobacteria)]
MELNTGAVLIATSDGLQRMNVPSVVCVPTYKRPELLRRTLGSLAAQRLERAAPFAIVVVDNDGQGREGSRIAARMLADGVFPGAALVQPRQGNCKAYNAAWRFVRETMPDTRFICGIDDDEEAAQGWLQGLVGAAEAHQADVVGGPVRPVFSHQRFRHLARHPVFRSHYSADGPVPQLFSSANYLIRAEVLDRMGYPYLDEAFDYKGGGDTDFFTRGRAAGLRFYWTEAALMHETIPARRTEFSWIHARALRNGMISALIAHKADPSPAGRARTALKSLALLAASPLRGVADLARTGSPLIALYHLQVALGRIGAEFGLNIEQYRAPEAN